MSPPGPTRAVRIANCSGFWGDRASAPAELLAGPDPVDVLTGDYLAELTMLLLWKARRGDPGGGYAATFLTQLEAVLGTCLARGVRIVVNVGGLNPTGLAERIAELGDRLGLTPGVAVVEGDDMLPRLEDLQAAGETLAHLHTGTALAARAVTPLTANAYLGGWGIAAGLAAGADIVVCPRVTDASLVVGPAAWWHRWSTSDWDALAGAVVAGHLIECGPQATGGNYPFLEELPDHRPPGFPIAEVAADGSSVITKQPGTGGVVSVGTVTAQLLYELAAPAYANPDVVARFDTVSLTAQGPDRVGVHGARGEPAPERLKVAINYDGGYRNTMGLVLTGLDVAAKAAHAEAMLWAALGGKEQFAEVDVRLLGAPAPGVARNEDATAELRITVKDPDPVRVGRRFSAAVIELSLASYAGFFPTSPPTRESAYGVYWPTLVPASAVDHTVRLPGGEVRHIPHPTPSPSVTDPVAGAPGPAGAPGRPGPKGPTAAVPLGRLCGARSGDKGGNANVGVWTWDDDLYDWLAATLTAPLFATLLPEAAGLAVERYELPAVRALNFVVFGLLGEGVAASTRPDPQAKGLGEFLRSRPVDVPTALLDRARPPLA